MRLIAMRELCSARERLKGAWTWGRFSGGSLFIDYNLVRIHQTLKVMPAAAAGVTPKLWEMSDTVKVLENWEISTKAG